MHSDSTYFEHLLYGLILRIVEMARLNLKYRTDIKKILFWKFTRFTFSLFTYCFDGHARWNAMVNYLMRHWFEGGIMPVGSYSTIGPNLFHILLGFICFINHGLSKGRKSCHVSLASVEVGLRDIILVCYLLYVVDNIVPISQWL